MNLQELLKELKQIEFTDLVDLYLEAKTGKQTTAIDFLPMEVLEIIGDLNDAIKAATEIN